MKPSLLFLSFLFVFIIWQCSANENIRIFLIGDSTMADKPLEDNPERGWGQMLPEFFNEHVHIFNHAVNGRSTKSFIAEGRWQTVLDSLTTGDYVMIQFGHNDEKDYDTTRYAAPHGAYKSNLEKFVSESRSNGAIPILLTPIVRRRFDEEGQFYDTHGEYPDVVREVAAQMDVALIDMHQFSRELIIKKGEEGSKEIYLWIKPGEYARFPEGKEDNTHFSETGARMMAGLATQRINDMDMKLKNYLVNE
jgi:DNA sulfur modification protein DndE